MAQRLPQKRPSAAVLGPTAEGDGARSAPATLASAFQAMFWQGPEPSVWLKENKVSFMGYLLCVRGSVWCAGAFTKPLPFILRSPWNPCGIAPFSCWGGGKLRLRKVEHAPEVAAKGQTSAPLRASCWGLLFSFPPA